MDSRRKDEKPVEDTMWSSRRVRVPARPVSSPQRTSATPQLPKQPEAKAVIPLLDDEDDSPKSVDINITFPSLPKPPKPGKLLKSRRAKTLALLLLVGAGVYYFGPFQHLPGKANGGGIAGIGKVKSENISQTPDYATVLPAGKKIEEFGGWKRVSPPDRNPVFAYPDKVNEVTITVSEQPLPENLKTKPELIEDLAKSYNATEKVTIGDHTAYIGTSAKGPQSVIFTKNDLLILIKSSNKLTANQWAAYISSLQ